MKLFLAKLVYGLVTSIVGGISVWIPAAPTLQPDDIQRSMVRISTSWTVSVQNDAGGVLVPATLSMEQGCSGFFVDTMGHVLTAGHCTDRDYSLRMLLSSYFGETLVGERHIDDILVSLGLTDIKMEIVVEQPQYEGIDGLVIDGTRKASLVDVEFDQLNNGIDWALLKVEDMTAATPPLAMATKPLRIGERINTVGYPALFPNNGQLFEYVPGHVTGLPSHRSHNFTTVSAVLWHGASGGPCINNRGEVVGINSASPIEANGYAFITNQEDTRQFLVDNHITAWPQTSEPAPTDNSVPAWMMIGAGGGVIVLVAAFLRLLVRRRQQSVRRKELSLPKQ